MTLFIKKGDKWEEANNAWTKVDGEWKKATDIWTKVKGKWEHLIGPSVEYGKVYYKATPDSEEVLSVEIQSIEEFNSLCNSALGWSTTINGITLSNNAENCIVGAEIGTEITSIGNFFLRSCEYLDQPLVIPDNVTTIGNSFLRGCSSFNKQVTLSNSITSIGNLFLSQSTSFNQPITIPNTVKSIGTQFLSSCASFNQSIDLSSELTSIGGQFLSSCTSFNQPLVLPNKLTDIGSNFLMNCRSFNQSLTIPDTVTSIGYQFLYNCTSLNGNDSSINIGNIPVSALSTTGRHYAFATTFADADCYTIGIRIEGENKDEWINTLDNSTTSPYRKLLSIDNLWGYITYWDGDSTTEYKTLQMVSKDDWNLLGNYNTSADTAITIQGVTLTKGANNAIRSVYLTSKVQSLPHYFLYYCTKIGDTNIDLSQVNGVGSHCLAHSGSVEDAIKGELKLPYGEIGKYFAYQCNLNFTRISPTENAMTLSDWFMHEISNFDGSVYCNDVLYDAIKNLGDNTFYVFANESTSVPAYQNGIKLFGDRASDVKGLLPDRSSALPRKLIVL